MVDIAREEVFSPDKIACVHVMNRAVRRCFLLGDDPITGKNFDHRKVWMEKKLEVHAANFGIDLMGSAIMSNHFHLVLRSRPDVVEAWDDAPDILQRVAWGAPAVGRGQQLPRNTLQLQAVAVISLRPHLTLFLTQQTRNPIQELPSHAPTRFKRVGSRLNLMRASLHRYLRTLSGVSQGVHWLSACSSSRTGRWRQENQLVIARRR